MSKHWTAPAGARKKPEEGVTKKRKKRKEIKRKKIEKYGSNPFCILSGEIAVNSYFRNLMKNSKIICEP